MKKHIAEIDKKSNHNFGSSIVSKTKKVFVSHSSKDISFVSLFVNLLEDIGLTEEDIVCSSIPGYGIPLGHDIYDWLSNQFQSCNLHITYILSKNYYDSVACLNEMGAAWVLKQKYDTVLLPGFDFPQIDGAINPQQIGIKLDSELTELKQRLNELKDGLIQEFELGKISASKWERNRDEFILKINNLAESQAILKNEETYEDEELKNKNSISRDAAVLLSYASDNPSGKITMKRSVIGLSVVSGKWNFVDSKGGAQEEARWNGAIAELEYYGMIQAENNSRHLFTITDLGYKIANEVKEKIIINTDNPPHKYLITE